MKGRRLLTFLPLALLLAVQMVTPMGTVAQAAVTIYDIQYTTDPSGDSPYDGQTVTTVGVVSAVNSSGYVIQDRQGGAWNGIYVYDSSAPSIGDEIEITGEVSEYYGLTELSNITALETKSTGNGIPTVELTASKAMTEAYEGVLVATYAVTVTSEADGNGNWEVSDASGSAMVGDELYAYSPSLNQNLTMLRGVVWYDWGDYKIEPRSAADVVDAAEFTIYDIQYPGGDSPELGNTITVTGTVVGAYSGEGYVLEDPSGGPWSGVFVDDTDSVPAEGDEVTLTGDVAEGYGLTQITNVTSFNVNSSGNALPTLEGVSTDWIATGSARAESYEGVLIATDAVTVTDDALGYGEWEITDVSGTGARVDDMAGYSYSPSNGDTWHSVQGVLWYSYGDYKIEPRSDADFISSDTTPPTVASTDPADGATDANPYFPVKAVFDEEVKASTVNAANFTLVDASGPVNGTVYYDTGRTTAVFDPDEALTAGTVYTATVKAAVEDKAGNAIGADYVWTFTATAATFDAYHGSIHNHTSYSDGTADPETAFGSGKARGLDFMALTDHSYSIDDTEWEDTLTQALSATVDGSYVALRGCEFTQGTEGHINVFNTLRHPVRNDTGDSYADYTPTLADFYDWLTEHPEAMGQFNHPGWMNFNDWAYRADAEPMMQLLEVGNGAYSYYVWTEEEYRKALDYGWYVGPSNNGDTHTDEWAIDNPGRTGIWATELTYDGVLEAMEAMRTFATEDGNFEIYLKGDGAWMGETIPSDGAIDFEIYVDDPDAESLVSLELYTDQGVVVTSTVPTVNPYTWSFDLPISEGVHYFFARAVQADGDRTVSAPIWTEGDVDVAPTKLEITPAQLSTKAPANFTARVTNRGAADATDVTVTFKVDTTVVGTEVITVPAGGDAFASVGWTPDVTGTVTIAAEISGVPAGDNPDDNAITVEREIVDYVVPLIVIDNGHDNNVFVSGDGSEFEQDLVDYGFNWIEDTDGITTTDLESAVLLVISDPGSQGDDLYTEAEEQAIADYVNGGGALLIAGDSDYHEHGNVGEVNGILDKIDDARIRLNSDGTYDDTDNGGVGPWHVLWHNFPATDTTGIGVNVNTVVGFSGCSIYGVETEGTLVYPVPLTTTNGVTVTVVGDDDTYQNDGDGLGDHFVYPEDMRIPMAAVQELPGGGRIAVWGDSNESFSDSYTYVPGDGYQNEIYNMQTIYWLLGHPLEKWDIAEARYDAGLNDTPDHLNQLVWVEGTVTADYGTFFDVLYVQDDTGGVTVFAPVTGEGGTSAFKRGDKVRVVGRVETYQGDTEVEVSWDLEQIQVIGSASVPDPLELSTHNAALEANEGWLIQTYGRVVAKTNDYNFLVDDGSGPARAFIDGYNGSFADVEEGDWAEVIGLASEDGDGQRIRVRSTDDVTITAAKRVYLPLIMRNG